MTADNFNKNDEVNSSESEIFIESEDSADDQAKQKNAVVTNNLTVYFNKRSAIEDVNVKIKKNSVTAVIGPSGCGKSTFLRSLNMMHEMTPSAKVFGEIYINGESIMNFNMVDLRKKVGMVFQKPNPFPTMSIFDNVAAGFKLNGSAGKNDLNEIVEKNLINAGLWDEVKDRLKSPAVSLSGGQQQRLCIARTIAVNPEIVLLDEPTSALDPVSSSKIEELLYNLKSEYTIIIVTHNMQQAARVSDQTAFFYLGKLIEISRTRKMFTNPKEKLTEEYITGKFG
ncbi:MAG TPA: phosphate ABC transporter ATP-binding protein PstB [Ignavibacteria bacterium]|nr:phosphate ABC transporter ATP-binding protein [Bacteroidota bacterium]HRI86024.1 phosphate ABC transporter ATP-binding protein PstB [Ignavibacteria bacterium]HRJ98251.1 phosphate ABC transporter ATP-binding protein PstB [Ignavibacteria bacterium]